MSTKIATSSFGKRFVEFIFMSSRGLKVYEAFNGIKLKLTQDEAIMMGILHFGVINLYETEVLNKIVKEGDVFVDVGAYVDGWYSLLSAKKVGSKGHVYTFEPNPDCFKRLKQNVNLNNFNNLTLEKVALSKRNGYRTFYLSANTSSFYKNHFRERQKKLIRVKTETLDSYAKRKKIKRIDFIKIDVECAEMDVLLGCKKILKSKDGPNLIVEVIDEHLRLAGSSKEILLKYLDGFGYKVFVFQKQGLVKYDPKSVKENYLNLFFTKRKEIINFAKR